MRSINTPYSQDNISQWHLKKENVLCYIERPLSLSIFVPIVLCVYSGQIPNDLKKKKSLSPWLASVMLAGWLFPLLLGSGFFFFFSLYPRVIYEYQWERENPGRPYRKNPAGKGRDLDQPSSTWLTSLGSYFFLCCWARLSRPPSSSLHPLSLFLAAAPFSFPSSQVGYLRSISLYARKSPSRFLYSSMMMENIHLMENFFFFSSFLDLL